jgi:hypothetical protein
LIADLTGLLVVELLPRLTGGHSTHLPLDI